VLVFQHCRSGSAAMDSLYLYTIAAEPLLQYSPNPLPITQS